MRKFLASALRGGVAWAILGFSVLAVPGMVRAHHPGGDAGEPWQSLGPFVFVLACVIAWLVWGMIRRGDHEETRERDATQDGEETDE